MKWTLLCVTFCNTGLKCKHKAQERQSFKILHRHFFLSKLRFFTQNISIAANTFEKYSIRNFQTIVGKILVLIVASYSIKGFIA